MRVQYLVQGWKVNCIGRERRRYMAHYAYQVAYTPEAWATLVKSPQNRVDAVRPAIEALGGRVEGAWFQFGKYDILLIAELPDNVSMAAFALAVAAGGAVKASKTTPLMTIDEGLQAMSKAGGSTYRPPS
jgi:uncharacterized protein with GYD domain